MNIEFAEVMWQFVDGWSGGEYLTPTSRAGSAPGRSAGTQTLSWTAGSHRATAAREQTHNKPQLGLFPVVASHCRAAV